MYKGEERRRRVRKTDIAQKLYTAVMSALTVIILSVIGWGVQEIIGNQQTLIINDEVAKEHMINSENNARETHKRHELRIESLEHSKSNHDKRLYKLENYAN